MGVGNSIPYKKGGFTRGFHSKWGKKGKERNITKKQKLFIQEGPELQGCLWCPL
jgi:hypothetical protein